jgi:hypothetical protein
VMYQLLNRASHVPSADRVGPEMRQEIINLEKVGKPILHICHLLLPFQRCTDRALTLVQSIEAIFKTIAAEVAKAVSVVRIVINFRPECELTILRPREGVRLFSRISPGH